MYYQPTLTKAYNICLVFYRLVFVQNPRHGYNILSLLLLSMALVACQKQRSLIEVKPAPAILHSAIPRVQEVQFQHGEQLEVISYSRRRPADDNTDAVSEQSFSSTTTTGQRIPHYVKVVYYLTHSDELQEITQAYSEVIFIFSSPFLLQPMERVIPAESKIRRKIRAWCELPQCRIGDVNSFCSPLFVEIKVRSNSSDWHQRYLLSIPPIYNDLPLRVTFYDTEETFDAARDQLNSDMAASLAMLTNNNEVREVDLTVRDEPLVAVKSQSSSSNSMGIKAVAVVGTLAIVAGGVYKLFVCSKKSTQ